MKTTAILFLITFLFFNIYYFSITLNSSRYLQKEREKLRPSTIIQIREKENCPICQECPVCRLEDIPAI